MDKPLLCSNCGEKLYRKCFLIDNKLYCNRCMRLLFMKDVSDLEYVMGMNEDDDRKDINEKDARQ